jgi:hypothetical protein
MGALGAGCRRDGGLTGAFSSRVESLGDSENANKQGFRAFPPVNQRERETL